MSGNGKRKKKNIICDREIWNYLRLKQRNELLSKIIKIDDKLFVTTAEEVKKEDVDMG